MKRRRQQSGSVTVLVAAMSLLLVAFVGLSVDGGEIETQQRESQNAADGAALAAATAVVNAPIRGYTLTDARNIGNTVTTYNGIPSSDTSYQFLDSSGSPAAGPSTVASVVATVTHHFGTLFLPVMGIDTATVSASATVTVTQVTGSDCAICVMSTSASPALLAQNGGKIQVDEGPVRVLSNGSPAITVQGGGQVQASAVSAVGSVSGTTQPSAQTGSSYAFTDPLAAVATPTLGLTANSVTYSSNTTINPGTYGDMTVPSGVTVTMNPGTYVIAGDLTVNGTLKGNSVTIFLTCSSAGVSAACASGFSGNPVSIAGTLTVSAPSSGTYNGLVIFGDRNDASTLTISGTINPTGTVYIPAMAFFLPHGSHQSLTSRLIAGTINIDNGGQLTLDYEASGNYVAPSKISLTQ